MADVTGGYPGSPEDERFTRRGSGAGKFQRPGTPNQIAQAQGMAGDWLSGMMGSLGLGGQVQPKVTGDVGPSSVEPTYGGGGRGSGAGGGRVTVGATGGGPGGPSGPGVPRGGLLRTATGEMRPGFGRAAFVGGMIPGVLAAGSELQANRPLGAAAALGTGALTAGVGATLLKTRNPLAMAVGGGLMLAGGPLAGMAAGGAEGLKQKITKEPTTGKENEFGTQMAMAEKEAELGNTMYRNQMGTYTSAIRDLSKYQSDLQYYDLQRNMPLVNQMKNADLIRQQSIIASQGQQLSNLSVLNTAGQLALGGQAQTGETVRTMLTANPYANAVLRA
jgi:hypothetical protein